MPAIDIIERDTNGRLIIAPTSEYIFLQELLNKMIAFLSAEYYNIGGGWRTATP